MQFYKSVVFSCCLAVVFINVAKAQSSALQDIPAGFERLSGRYLDVITDLPLDAELQEFPQVFEKAMTIWCQVFDVKPELTRDWHASAFIMLDRGRFEKHGFLPSHLPNFPYGFQFGDRLWVSEQPSPYYRRHLLLHEGTHWFMNRQYGGNGPPWLMEGMAEWLGTHEWNAQTGALTLGHIPAAKEQVPYWGRITRIQEQLQQGSAPSLEEIMRYGNTAHQEVEAYAWSWALVVFLRTHADTREAFDEMLLQPMKPDLSLTRWLFARLRARWPMIREEWNAFASDLEYGWDPSVGQLIVSSDPSPLKANARQVIVQANKSWQPSGIIVNAGQALTIEAQGEYSVGQRPKPWLSYPEGVTLEYHAGQPLGKLMMTIATPIVDEQATRALQIFPVGQHLHLTVQSTGELHFRINEASAARSDNTGTLTVTLQAQ